MLIMIHIIFLFFFFLVGCTDNKEYVERSANDLYGDAINAVAESKYQKAADAFLELERQHPYSDLALKAQIFSAYCFYHVKKYDDAIDGFTVFVKLHPGHKYVAYAYYMIGMCYYEQIPVIEREQKATEMSLKNFEELCSRFKDSKYAIDAKFKIAFLKEHLAAKQMFLGRFYQKESNPIAAIKHFQKVIESYQSTSHIEEALYRCVESYLMLNLSHEAKKNAAVLGHNYPKGEWFKRSFDLLKNCKIESVSVKK